MTTAWQGEDPERDPRTSPARPLHGEILPPAPSDVASYQYPADGSLSSEPALHQRPAASLTSRILAGWSYAPATYILIAINITVYLLMVLRGVSGWSPTAAQILHWGANLGAYEIVNGQWWRLLTATFVHIGILHIATNMWCLWNLGLLGEPLLGAFGMICVYAITGVAGNLLSTAITASSFVPGAGASGAVFGIAGILILLLNGPHLPFPRDELKRLRRSVIYFAAINLAIGASTLMYSGGIKIDNYAHLGGFLSGMALGLPLAPVLGTGKGRYMRRQRIAFAVAAVSLLLFANGIAHYWRPILSAMMGNS